MSDREELAGRDVILVHRADFELGASHLRARRGRAIAPFNLSDRARICALAPLVEFGSSIRLLREMLADGSRTVARLGLTQLTHGSAEGRGELRFPAAGAPHAAHLPE
jgi:hypothetical protein